MFVISLLLQCFIFLLGALLIGATWERALPGTVHNKSRISSISALLLGYLLSIFLITEIVFVLLLAGLPMVISSLVVIVSGVCLAGLGCWRFGKPQLVGLGFRIPTWYELLVCLLLLVMVILSIVYLASSVPTFSDDIRHWSGRARSLHGEVNWSWKSDTPNFLGHVGAKHYPMGLPIWRAFLCTINGWDDFISHVDGIFTGLCVLGLLWAIVYELTGRRWFAAMSVIIMLGFPIFKIHWIAGYADTLIAAYALGAVYCVLHKQWLLAGVFVAGGVWIKNDALVVLLPSIGVMTFFMQPMNIRKAAVSLGYFVLGVLAMLPWQFFRLFHGLPLSPVKSDGFEFKADAIRNFWNIVLLGDEHNFFWFMLFAALVFSLKSIWRDQKTRALLFSFIAMFMLVLFVFFATVAYRFMVNEMTVHRSMLQITPVGVALFVVAISKLSIFEFDNSKDKRSDGNSGALLKDGEEEDSEAVPLNM